jgi:hypothetical protein
LVLIGQPVGRLKRKLPDGVGQNKDCLFFSGITTPHHYHFPAHHTPFAIPHGLFAPTLRYMVSLAWLHGYKPAICISSDLLRYK